jgi:hypothetical protein
MIPQTPPKQSVPAFHAPVLNLEQDNFLPNADPLLNLRPLRQAPQVPKIPAPSILYALAVHKQPKSFLESLGFLPKNWQDHPLSRMFLKNFKLTADAYDRLIHSNEDYPDIIEYPFSLKKALEKVDIYLKHLAELYNQLPNLKHLGTFLIEKHKELLSIKLKYSIVKPARCDEDNSAKIAFDILNELTKTKTEQIIALVDYYDLITKQRQKYNLQLAQQMNLEQKNLQQGYSYNWDNYLPEAVNKMIEVGLYKRLIDNPGYQKYDCPKYFSPKGERALPYPIPLSADNQASIDRCKHFYAAEIDEMDDHLQAMIYDIARSIVLSPPSFINHMDEINDKCVTILTIARLCNTPNTSKAILDEHHRKIQNLLNQLHY